MERDHGLLVGCSLPALATIAALITPCSCRDYYVIEGAQAPGDAGDPVDGGSPCISSNIVFCDDFDADPLGAIWDSADTSFKALEEDRFVSAPRAMRVRITEPAPSDFASTLTKTLSAPTRANLAVDLALRIVRAGNLTPFGVFCGPNGYKIAFNLTSEGTTSVSEQGDGVEYTAYPTTASLPVDAWRHLQLRLGRTAGTVELKMDGASVLEATPLKGGAKLATGSCRLVLGIYFAPKGATWDAYYDDVVVTTF